jgi:hypothetical protein
MTTSNLSLSVIDEQIYFITRNFSHLSEEVLNAGKSNGNWSIAQCLQHIIKTNQSYFPALEKVANGNHSPTFWQKLSPLTKTISSNLTKELGVHITRKFKSPRLFLPVKGTIATNVVDDLTKNLYVLKGIMAKIEEENKLSNVISSPVSPLITLTVGSALNMLVGHSERHLRQAMALHLKYEINHYNH